MRHRDLVIACEQLSVLWPVLGLWHPSLLQQGTGLVDVIRFSGVELLLKNTINHVRKSTDVWRSDQGVYLHAPQARFRYQVILHMVAFIAVVKTCVPRLCGAAGPYASPLCVDVVLYGWQLSVGVVATLAVLYALETVMRLSFLCRHAARVD